MLLVLASCSFHIYEIHSRRNVLDDATEDGMIEKDDLRLSSPPTIIDIVSSPTCHMSGISSLLASFACSAGRAQKKEGRAGAHDRPSLYNDKREFHFSDTINITTLQPNPSEYVTIPKILPPNTANNGNRHHCHQQYWFAPDH